VTRNDALPRRRFRSLYLWHRYLGLGVALLVLLLSITGLALNHTEGLRLDERPVPWRWLARWYGLEPNPVTAFRTGNHWVLEAGGTLYLEGRAVARDTGALYGAAEDPPLVAAVTAQGLLLFSRGGELVELLRPGEGLPEPVLGIARDEQGIVVRGATSAWRPDPDWIEWRPHQGPSPTWARPVQPPAELLDRVRTADLARALSWERVLLDLHTGRILGTRGPLLMDLAAAGMITLALSGFWVWVQRRPRRRRPHRLP
jgi:hypothetical protein